MNGALRKRHDIHDPRPSLDWAVVFRTGNVTIDLGLEFLSPLTIDDRIVSSCNRCLHVVVTKNVSYASSHIFNIKKVT